MAASIQVQVSPTFTVPVVSLAALAILKIFAWQDRKTTDKDALDLYRAISTYADAGNEDRLYDPDSPHMEKFDYDPEFAGAALAGEDSRLLSSAATATKLRAFVVTEDFIDTLTERIRTSRWQFEPQKLAHVRAVLVAYFDELPEVGFHASHYYSVARPAFSIASYRSLSMSLRIAKAVRPALSAAWE